ncbi:glycerol acyltransferase, partial [Sphingobacterium siyangense]
LRQKLGLKVNIEMLYLPDEMFAQRGHTVNIIVGERIPYTAFDQSKNEKTWAEEVKRRVYGLAQEK